MVTMDFVVAQALARCSFNLELPCTQQELKMAFRQAAKHLHPDLNHGRDTTEDFKQMKSHYDVVCQFATADIPSYQKESIIVTADDGTPLSELGLGLGPDKNGRDCDACQHKGYKERISPSRCTACDTYGKVAVCPKCGGMGFDPSGKVTYYRCYTCNGTGEIEIWNPVLPKGRMRGKKNKDRTRKIKKITAPFGRWALAFRCRCLSLFETFLFGYMREANMKKIIFFEKRKIYP